MTRLPRMSDEEALDFAAALNEAADRGFAVWHLGFWPTRGWNCNLYRVAETTGGATETRRGDSAAAAIRNTMNLPDKTPDEALTEAVCKELGRAELIKAEPRLPTALVVRLLAALTENRRLRAEAADAGRN